MDFFVILLIISLILLLGFSTFVIYNLWSIQQPPANHPEWFLKQDFDTDKPRILFCGDSITHGTVQPNWTKLVENELGDGYHYINGGINGHTTADVLNRMDDMLACDPDLVTICIGNNNAMGTYKQNRKNYSDAQQDWSIEAYEQEIRQIITSFRETGAIIGVFSVLPYSERLESEEFALTKSYAEVVRRVCKDLDLTYFPIFETIEEKLRQEGAYPNAPKASDSFKLLVTGMLRRKLLGQSWDTISEARNLKFLVDNIHINDRSAELMADMAIEFVNSHLEN